MNKVVNYVLHNARPILIIWADEYCGFADARPALLFPLCVRLLVR